MFRFISLLAVCLLTASVGSITLADDIASLRQNCVACHGGITDGKKVIKGDFNIVPLLKDGIQQRHTTDWVSVVEQLRDEAMPPSDSKYRLTDVERESITNAVFTKLNRDTIEERLLTPFEISNTTSLVFGYDREIYDPFGNLYFLENVDSAYPTIDSPSLMSAAYLQEVESGLDLAIDHAVANGFQRVARVNTKKYKGINRFELRFLMTGTTEQFTGLTYLAYLEKVKLPIDTQRIKDTADPEERNRLKAINARANQEHMARIKATRNLDEVDLRMRGSRRLTAKEYRTNLPVGRYRLTFTASALNRDLVTRLAAAAAENEKKKGKGKKSALDTFRELHGAKAGLAVRHGGINRGPRGGAAAHSIPGKVIHYFEIEDDVRKEYTCEFELNIPTQIEMGFANGPISSRLNRLNLGGVSGKEGDPDKYGLPCIRIHSKIILERLGALAENYSPYQITEEDAPQSVLLKVKELADELSLPKGEIDFDSILGRLDSSFTPEQQYTQALKWVAMSPAQLYVRYDPSDSVASSRFLSYALLKRHPTKSFTASYQGFRGSRLSAADFAEAIVKAPGFDDFLRQFSTYWLENRTVLDETRFNHLDLNLPYGEETKNYLKLLFVMNRPVGELVDSDYRALTAPMASFYGMSAEGLARHAPKVVKTPGQGGLLHQANFFVARSDGVDPRPFSRAAWIAKNVFGQQLSEPPGDIDADEFVSTAEKLSFEERVRLHAQNTACASCHQKIDPIAFAVNDYDTIGRMTGTANVTAKRELESRLAQASATMARSFTRNLIAFSLGRDTNMYDMKTIETILDKTARNDYRAKDILAEVLVAYFKS